MAEQFPTLYRGNGMRVYKNPSDEIFVEDIKSGTTIRINTSHHPNGGLVFTTDKLVEPVRVTNMIGWHIGPR